MRFELRRATGAGDLRLTKAHAEIAAPRRGTIRWELDGDSFDATTLAAAADAWRARVTQEYASLALFTQISSQLHLLGAPLDWSGAFARMIADEVRHTELAARMVELCRGAPVILDGDTLHLPVTALSLRAHVRAVVVAAFCIGETISGRMFRRCLRAATVPVAKDVVRAICDDETFHGRFGWEIAALLMRDDDASAARQKCDPHFYRRFAAASPSGTRPVFGAPPRGTPQTAPAVCPSAAGPELRVEFSLGGTSRFADERTILARQLPEIFAHYRSMCGADRGAAWARTGPETTPAPNFGTLTDRGYARAFWDGMEKDVVPGLCAIGLAEAQDAWKAIR